MFKWLIRNRLAAFERSFDYDMSYVRSLLAADARAFWAFSRVQGISRYRRDVPVDAYYAAKLVGLLGEDCGPCTQLVVAMALRDGVSAQTLAAVLGAKDDALSEQVLLCVVFARAVVARSQAAEPLREQVLTRFGERGLVSLAFALTAARIFPTLKYALGHGSSCQRVQVQGELVPVVRSAA
jgi:hypothetical protein